MKLTGQDKRILALFGTQDRSVAELARELGIPLEDLGYRLKQLAANGLVNDHGDGEYSRTESGRRVLVVSPMIAVDERIDTTAEVECTLNGFGLRPDEADAVRHVFAFIRYWGRVLEEEIIDAVYPEEPAGRETPEEWWDNLVCDALVTLPEVEPPVEGDATWRYTGRPEVDEPFADGRRMLSRKHPVYGDVKHTLESLDLTKRERDAARAAFQYLYHRGEATEGDIRDAVYSEFDAGFSSSQALWDGVIRKTFNALPGVDEIKGGRWRYRRP